MVSLYSFCTQIKTKRRYGKNGKLTSNKDIIGLEFNTWLTTKFHGIYQVSAFKRRSLTTVPQCEWIFNKKNQVGVDRVIKYENLIEGLSSLKEDLNITEEIKLPHVHKTDRKSYKDYFNESGKSWIEKHFKIDMEQFDYEY